MKTPLAFLASLTVLTASPSTAEAPLSASRGIEEGAPAQAGSGLPFARGKTFSTLDAYLAHLEAQGAYDVPWYREVRPGVYERVAGRRRPGEEPRFFTRRELAAKYGFRD